MTSRTTMPRLAVLTVSVILASHVLAAPAAAQGGIRGFFKKLEEATRLPETDGAAGAAATAGTAGTAGRVVGVPPGYAIDPAIVRRGHWVSSPSQFDGRLDQEFAFRCPAGGSVGPVYGTGVYPTFVNACSAAVHAGRITARDGGIIVLRILPGRSSYAGSRRNGVTSESDRASEYSYALVDPPASMLVPIEPPAPVAEVDAADVQPAEWYTDATDHVGRLGQVLAFRCPAGGQVRIVAGTDIYVVNSSICSAAAHAGKITVRDGGLVGIELRPGQLSYVPSTRYGVPSEDWDQGEASFVLRDVRLVETALEPTTPVRRPADRRDVPTIVEGEQGIEVRLPAPYAAALRRAVPTFAPFEAGSTVDRMGIQELAGGSQSDHAAVADLNGDTVLDVVMAGMMPGAPGQDPTEVVVAVISTGTTFSVVRLSSEPLHWQDESGAWLTNMKVTLTADGARRWVRYADVDLKSGGWEWRFGGSAPAPVAKRPVASDYQD